MIKEKELELIKSHINKSRLLFGLSLPGGLTTMVNLLFVPDTLSTMMSKPGPYLEFFPAIIWFSACFAAWLVPYELAELELIKGEGKNYTLAVRENLKNLPVGYKFPDFFISHINLAHIKIRKKNKFYRLPSRVNTFF